MACTILKYKFNLKEKLYYTDVEHHGEFKCKVHLPEKSILCCIRPQESNSFTLHNLKEEDYNYFKPNTIYTFHVSSCNIEVIPYRNFIILDSDVGFGRAFSITFSQVHKHNDTWTLGRFIPLNIEDDRPGL